MALLVGASAAHAQASRTWVSGVGDDVNPCSRTAPCKTFAGAISKTAAKGEINVLDPGGFGGVTITKSITIDGSEQLSGVLASGTNAIVINAATTDIVSLRNLDINGFGTGLNGIRILGAAQVHIENCVIHNFGNRGIEIANSAGTTQVYVKNSVIKNNFAGGGSPAGNSGGILVKPTSAGGAVLTVDDSNIDQNFFGLRAEGNTRVVASRSSFSGNTSHGVIAITTALINNVNVEHSTIANNGTGVHSEGSNARLRISNNIVVGNGTGLSTAASGQLISFGNNSVAGNTTDGSPTSTIPQI
jgi:hypothetical protein